MNASSGVATAAGPKTGCCVVHDVWVVEGSYVNRCEFGHQHEVCLLLLQ
jgi:hypothetical protein